MRVIRLALIVLAAAAARPAAAQQVTITAADYARAERVHEMNVRGLVDRNQPTYRWSADSGTVFYEINDGGRQRHWRIDMATRTRTEVAAPAPPAPPSPDALPAPDGSRAVVVRGHDLWLRTPGGARQLTRDGAPDFAYGAMPDFLYRAVPRLDGQKAPPMFVTWSPDGRWLFGQRYDQRAVKPYPYVAWTPADGDVRPKLYTPRVALVGDPDQAIPVYFLIDAQTGAGRASAGLDGWTIDSGSVIWSARGDKAWVLATAKTGNGGALLEFDPATMRFRPLITERRAGFFFFNPGSLYTAPNVRVLGDGREALWFSSRDGWGNLYLYDLATGRVKRQLTRGPGTVLDVVAVDEAKRRVFFTGAGRHAGIDPYLRQLYSVSLDGGAVRAITDDAYDHEIAGPIAPLFKPFFRAPPGVGALSPDGRWFVDVASRLDTPPVITLRSTETGKVVLALDRADPSRFLAAGGRAPERFCVKAADGKTDIWGAIWLPPGYDPAKKYSVIDGIYAGPQVIVAPRTWNEGSGARPQMFDRNSLAQLGFIVVTIDARGTPGRSAAFQDVGYGNFADPQLDDHVAALRQLALRYPGIDLTRVGAFGHSLGGYTSARALLRYPDFYKVAVSSAGVHAWERFPPSYNSVFGEPDYGDGRTVRPDHAVIPRNLAAVDNTLLADRLKGHLLLAYGELDENAPPANTMALIDALTKANKRYDLMVLANTTHGYGALNYFTLRLWGYFVEHLHGTAPPDYRFAAQAPPRLQP